MNFSPFGYEHLFAWMADSSLAHWLDSVPQKSEDKLARHGDLPRWLAALEALPKLSPSHIDLSKACIEIGYGNELTEATRKEIRETLLAFHPWRKGPFCPYGIHIDTEWRSDWKWARIEDAIDLKEKTVLDVGSGNGYYGWRMLGAGAERVIGIDPTISYVMQYTAMRHFIGERAMHILPLKLDEIPEGNKSFDTVFSMGVIYHRKDHMEHIEQLIQHLKPGGQLIIEGLVIECHQGELLHPNGRYAKMKNVHTLPSPATLMLWLEKAGLSNIELIDVSPTTADEQRRTEWMHFESMANYLDPDNPNKTVEGHPAPIRAIVSASL
ncbi:tRNA 5-methoxyuridine(34)/uridine 5-oxyacetic acid(34) synthase CmoB [Solemya pervernicosa gill symbiont]|uniref:tRNA U34 carboxymethyltransferase n=2 Tax=Gammaproteobacteria incertae sedis TaxID=118884 RepID=A0A1T2LAU8_9GAMM|nr:tRNA 5-methoxyuridine(34)/uridine 5-oxyacetic acid(34) synthase CmoB [Candidatus Reidiella endopervernicosa]OOZ42223.1 tRNA 5-methoxyuridine(34)/uridine 5-oxyacetic acid(34) synthase CmoB [Solemya pervernicosa gill symbiont]QKQ27212.1 tRNA 5-methoxyuridine(34)/uridine 5-oxyacetic acid(34) synthase CmoB [Candidatus Reidiella endopervernicosa]